MAEAFGGERGEASPRWIGLVGPTASGKSALALSLAQALEASGRKAEIISVDSALVYRGMDIGTAKPSLQEQAQLPHHLIDIRDPAEAYSAAEFVRDVHPLLRAIHARGAVPLLVGGTMLYLKALRSGLDDLPSANAQVREEIDTRAKTQGWPALHQELAQIDPITAARLSPGDSQRIQRALEVYALTGQPLSALHTAKTIADIARAERAASDQLIISLEPQSRQWLHQRIAQRFDAMLDQGLVEEVKSLRARGDLHADLPSMRCVGYRQVWQMLDGSINAAEMREQGLAATRQLAKRQLTWLRSTAQRQVLSCDTEPPLPAAWELVQEFLAPVKSRLGSAGFVPDKFCQGGST